ncbi:metalloprotease [Coemansia sp. BCRC 34301]|nr:metalloprotease [Coemansia sp. BCRC 34301]
MQLINNCAPADWQTNFEPKLSVASSLPYDEFTGSIETSGNDKHQHRLVRLPNNLVALCVQDNDAKEAAVSLSVNGTAKYPDEKEYKAFLAKNGGKSNAYTGFTETNYYFSVSNDALEGAIDRFAQFFISPLFNADCVNRELKAVDSEYKMNLQNDGRRFYQLQTRTTNSAHPISRFPTGNLQTLRDAAKDLGLDLHEELVKFHDKYYSADMMRIVVVGNYNLDVLTELVASKFSDVKSKKDARPRFGIPPVGKAELGKLIRYRTVNEKYELKLKFALPEIKSLYREKPFEYIDSLLGHKESGSIYSVLRTNSWATDIQAYSSGEYYDEFGIYSIDITATPEGLENYEAIVSIVFGYINMLIEHGPQEWYYKELSLISKAKFDYKDKEDAETYARTISKGAHNQYIPPHHILSHEALMIGYNAELISKCLSYLNSGNYRLFVGAQEHQLVECTLEEKYYSILHYISDLPLHMISNVSCSSSVAKMLHLPGRNAFLPDNLSVSKPDIIADPPSLEPVLLRKDNKMEVWFKQDDQFFTPHGSIGLTISSQSVDNLPINRRINSFIRDYRQKLQDLTTEEFKSLIQSQINMRLEKLKSIDDEFDRLWTHIRSGQYKFGALDDDIEHLKQLCKEDLLLFWDKYINEDTAPTYTRMDMQMWSSKIWQPTAEEFEMYPSAVIALYGCLRSSGYTGLSIANVQSFVLAEAASGNSDVDSLLAELKKLYWKKYVLLEIKRLDAQAKAMETRSVVAMDSVEAPNVTFENSSNIATALLKAVGSANDKPKFKALCKTNFAAIDMKQSPEGIWLLNDYTQFKSTQALHGLPVPVHKFVPNNLESTCAESTIKLEDNLNSKASVLKRAWKRHEQSAAARSKD